MVALLMTCGNALAIPDSDEPIDNTPAVDVVDISFPIYPEDYQSTGASAVGTVNCTATSNLSPQVQLLPRLPGEARKYSGQVTGFSRMDCPTANVVASNTVTGTLYIPVVCGSVSCPPKDQDAVLCSAPGNPPGTLCNFVSTRLLSHTCTTSAPCPGGLWRTQGGHHIVLAPGNGLVAGEPDTVPAGRCYNIIPYTTWDCVSNADKTYAS